MNLSSICVEHGDRQQPTEPNGNFIAVRSPWRADSCTASLARLWRRYMTNVRKNRLWHALGCKWHSLHKFWVSLKKKNPKIGTHNWLLHSFLLYDAHLAQLRNRHTAVKLLTVDLVYHLRFFTKDNLEVETHLCICLQVTDCFLLRYVLQEWWHN